MLDDEIEKKIIKKTSQNYDTGYDTELTMYKANHNKLWSLIFNKLNIEVWY